jgi:predicted alpha/beta-fold hydrolase
MEAFEAHGLLRGFHRMTIASMFIRGDLKDPLPQVEERLFEVDVDTQVLALCSWQPEPSPVLVMVHGFAGHADRPYMRGVTRKAFAAGFHVVRLNIRNCGGTEHLAGSMYHAGLVSDLAAVVATLQDDAGCHGIHLAGFSMGGNVVLRLGGLWGEASPSPVASIVAVSPVIDLAHCAANLDRRLHLRPYRNSFLRGLRAVYRRRAELFPVRYEPGRLAGVRTLRAFDELVTAPDCGFSGVDEYYRSASSRWELPRLRIPSLVLHARDDLLVPFPEEQLQALEEAPAVRLLWSPHGGHCGFVGGRVPDSDVDRYWAENRLVQFADWMERHTAP